MNSNVETENSSSVLNTETEVPAEASGAARASEVSVPEVHPVQDEAAESPQEDTAVMQPEPVSLAPPEVAPAPAPGTGPQNEPAGTHYGAVAARPIPDAAWEAAKSAFMTNHIQNSAVSQATDAWNHLHEVFDHFRTLLENSIKTHTGV